MEQLQRPSGRQKLEQQWPSLRQLSPGPRQSTHTSKTHIPEQQSSRAVQRRQAGVQLPSPPPPDWEGEVGTEPPSREPVAPSDPTCRSRAPSSPRSDRPQAAAEPVETRARAIAAAPRADITPGAYYRNARLSKRCSPDPSFTLSASLNQQA